MMDNPGFRYFLKLSFHGEGFHGWQAQHNAPSIQSALGEALTVILRQPTEVTGAGRTDAGVHAREFYAHFDTETVIDVRGQRNLAYHLNSYLPEAIAIREIIPVRSDAHARFSARSRTYKYYIHRHKDPFRKGVSWHYEGILDIDLMNRGADIILRTKDFTSFARLPAETRNNLCDVIFAQWVGSGDQLIFTITANRFLRNMVRAITGTLIDLGRNKIDLEGLVRIIDARDRRAAGYSVPANGLFLHDIEYPPEIFLTSCR